MVKVTIYSAPGCEWCEKAKAFFDERKIKYKDINVLESEENEKEMMELTGGMMGTPVIVIDGKVIQGFDEDRLKEELGE